METLQAIRGRKSVRAFLPRPVTRGIVAEILQASRWAPSGSNGQRWRVTVATGDKREILAKRLTEWARSRKRVADGSQGQSHESRRDVDSALLKRLREAAESRGQSFWEAVVVGSYGFYDAPVVIVVSHPEKSTGDTERFVTTLLLVAHDMGLGTCWLGYPLSCQEAIHEVLGIPEEEQLCALVALGYPDQEAPINRFRSSRRELDTFVRWVGYD